MPRLRTSIGRFVAGLTVLLVLACGGAAEPSRWDAIQAQTVDDDQAPAVASVSDAAIEGSRLNTYFPSSSDAGEVVFKQEKTGFAQALVTVDGEPLVTLSISDTRNNPSARDKFADATETAGGFPLVTVGSKSSAVLVADRFQVQVRAEAEGVDPATRAAWLERFDLGGLSQAF